MIAHDCVTVSKLLHAYASVRIMSLTSHHPVVVVLCATYYLNSGSMVLVNTVEGQTSWQSAKLKTELEML
jgi:hypothetical protein